VRSDPVYLHPNGTIPTKILREGEPKASFETNMNVFLPSAGIDTIKMTWTMMKILVVTRTEPTMEPTLSRH